MPTRTIGGQSESGEARVRPPRTRSFGFVRRLAGFNFTEVQSAAHEGLKVTTLVFAEGSWTLEEPSERMLQGRTFGTDLGTVRGIFGYGAAFDRWEGAASRWWCRLMATKLRSPSASSSSKGSCQRQVT